MSDREWFVSMGNEAASALQWLSRARLEFSRNYADQNEANYAMFMEKIRSGLIETSAKE